MANTKFEIKIAVPGCESTGKSTVVNAICAEKCSEAAYGRTTAGINIFRLFEAASPKIAAADQESIMIIDEGDGDGDGDNSKRPRLEAETGPAKKRFRPVESTYGMIKEKNHLFASGGGNVSSFDVPVAKLPITMREDSQFVVVEAPGLNVSKPYSKESRAYFRDNWESFDAVVLVMDAKGGADHEDQSENLNFIHDLLQKKNVPCFILCNKVDDPDNLSEEEAHKLKAARNQVQSIWNVGCREKALEELVTSHECSKYKDVFPVFVPVSAKTAFLLRAGATMTKEAFAQKMDPEDYHSVGLQYVGREWRKMDRKEKAGHVHGMLQDEQIYKELLRMSGFHKFLECLEKLLGGTQAQTSLIEKNYIRDLKNDNFAQGNLYSKLRSHNDKGQILGAPSHELTKKMWQWYPKLNKPAIEALEKDCSPEGLAFAGQKLIEYLKFCKDLGWDDEISKVKEEMSRLVRVLVATINNRAIEWSPHVWESESRGKGDCGWKHLSPIDWQNILSSILLLKCEPIFCRLFGPEIGTLERHQSKFNLYSFGCSEGCDSFPCPDHETHHDSVKFKFEPVVGSLKQMPADTESFSRLITIEIAGDYTVNQKHFAHVGWLFCKCMA